MGTNSATKHAAGKRKTQGGASNRGHKKGQGTLKSGSSFSYSAASSKAGRTTPGGEKRVRTPGSHMRTEGKIKLLKMYTQKPKAPDKRKEQSLKPMRIQPDRRWFGNTRVIAQDKMQAFRETIAKGVEDPFSVVLKSSKLPMSLLRETEGKASRMDLLSIQPFKEVFSKKHQQKRPKIGSSDLEGLLKSADTKAESYASGDKDVRSSVDDTGHNKTVDDSVHGHKGEEIFNKGTSKRIWGELYKVVDSSDVLVFVLDARDPQGTRCRRLEQHLRKTKSHKHIVLLLNKVDLVPTWVSRRWVQELMRDFPTIAFHASITNPFGKNALLNLLRQFSTLLKDKKHITVGLIGYPNVGKSAVINTLKKKKVCNSAPVPGETRVWQYVALTKRIYLLDCPGIVPATASDFEQDCAKVLKGVVRAEKVLTPSDYIDEVITRVKKQYLLQRYKLPEDTEWADGEEFLSILGRKMGKLHKGGEPHLDAVARIVLYDWQRGRLPYFTPPPEDDAEAPADAAAASSSSSPAAPATTAGAREAEAEGAVEGELALVPSIPGQSWEELQCVHAFDDEDRRGEAALFAEGASSLFATGRAPKRRKGREDRVDAGAEESGVAERGKRQKQGAPGGQRSNPIKTGSVDWKAMVAEFGV